MSNEDYASLITRMNEIRPTDRAAVLVVLEETDEGRSIHTSTFGEPADVRFLKKWIGGV